MPICKHIHCQHTLLELCTCSQLLHYHNVSVKQDVTFSSATASLFHSLLGKGHISLTHTHTHTTQTPETTVCGEWDKKQDKAIIHTIRHNTRDINDGSYDISWFIYIFRFTSMTSPNTDISGQLVWCLTAAPFTYDHKNRWHRCPHLTHNKEKYPWKTYMYTYEGEKTEKKRFGVHLLSYKSHKVLDPHVNSWISGNLEYASNQSLHTCTCLQHRQTNHKA